MGHNLLSAAKHTLCVRVCARVCVHVHMCVRLCICVCVCAMHFIHFCVSMCECGCMCVRVPVCVYCVYMSAYIYAQVS